MSEKITKILRRHAKSYELPKNVIRKVNKLRSQYGLNLTDSLFLLDVAAKKYYDAMNQVSDEIEKELENEKN